MAPAAVNRPKETILAVLQQVTPMASLVTPGSGLSHGAARFAAGCLSLALALGMVRPKRGGETAQRQRRWRPMAQVVSTSAEEVAVESPSAEETEMHSPFESSEEASGEKPKLPLTWENVEAVLDELRPYLQSDGGDCSIVEIDGPVVRLELQGACSSCSASSVTLKMGIERTLAQRIPEIKEVVAVLPDQEPLSEEGLDELLEGIRPFLKTSGGSIAVQEIIEGASPRVVLKMLGPPLKSTAVRVEVTNRVRRKFPVVMEVTFVGEDG